MIHNEQINNKLLVLFVLDKLEMPINEDILLHICSIDNNWMAPIFCKQIASELIDGGFVAKKASGTNNNGYLTLTADGRTCLSHFYNDIPFSVRESVSDFLKKERLNYRKKQEFFCDYFRNGDSTYSVRLVILEISKPIFETKLIVPSLAIATSIYNSWQDKAPEVYKAIHEILIEL